MAKIPCAECGRGLGALSQRVLISNGAVCMDCLHSAGMSGLSNARYCTEDAIRSLIASRRSLVRGFNATKSVVEFLCVDEDNQAFKIGNDIFSYENLLSFELIEDEEKVIKGGVGRSLVGGLLFGSEGAMIGGVTGKKKTKGVCNSMKLRVSLKNAHVDVVYIDFILGEAKVGGWLYSAARDNAYKCVSALEIINDINLSLRDKAVQSFSAADEIVKFKALLDQGIITQEEFDAKKKELLGL